MIKDWLRKLKPLDEDTAQDLESLRGKIPLETLERIEELLKTREIKFIDEKYPVDTCLPESHYLKLKSKDKTIQEEFTDVNALLAKEATSERMNDFAKRAPHFFQQFIEPSAITCTSELITLQLATPSPIHVMLIGNPLHTKPYLERAAMLDGERGDENDILPQKDQSILAKCNGKLCALQLDTLKAGNRTAIYETIMHGYVKHHFGISHERIPAATSILAAVKPKGSIKNAKRQPPLDKAFIDRFIVVILGAAPQKSKELSTADIRFIRAYFALARSHKPNLSHELKELLHKSIHPENATKLAIAGACLELRDEVLRRDVDNATRLVNSWTYANTA